jgi:hypothetical protein
MNMRTRFLVLGLTSSAIACSDPSTLQIHSHVETQLQPGQSATLVELQDDRHWFGAIALSENYLFFTVAWAGVYRMPKYGGDIVALEEDPSSDFGHVVTDGERVYWNHNQFDSRDYVHTEVRSQPVDGGPTTTLTAGDIAIASFSVVASLQAAGGYLYWVADSGGGTPGVIERVSARGGPRETMFSAADITMLPYWIADDSGVYLTTTPVIGSSNGGCLVEHISTPGQAPEVVRPCPTSDSYVIGSDANLVYLESAQGFWRLSKQDGSVEQIAFDEPVGGVVKLDESNFYGVTDDPFALTAVSFPKVGGSVTPIADVTGCFINVVSFMAVDRNYLYFTCGTDGPSRINVFPRPATP